jgi:type 1 fimbriae regulatory protein FimB
MATKASAVPTHRTVQSLDPVDASPRDYLTEREMELFCKAAKHGRHGARDYAMVLLAYRHGLRVSELVEMRLDQLDWHTAHLWVARKKGSLSTQHPLDGDELRALRAWCRTREHSSHRHLPYVFLSERGPCTRQMFNYLVASIGRRAGLLLHVHPHMLRHSCGYALANQGRDTRLIQDYLGHRNVQHTVRYTRTAAARFEGLWRSVGGDR